LGRLTLRLPNTLHTHLESLARHEGVSLNQYVVFALTRQATIAYMVQRVPEREIERQHTSFAALLEKLGPASFDEIAQTLRERETAEPDSGLDAEALDRLHERIQKFSPPK
jgi:hypothetical protein